MMATPEREEQAFIAPTTTLSESAMRHRGWVPSTDPGRVHALTWENTRLRDALTALYGAADKYLEYWGLEHDDPGCPEDDECTCPVAHALDEAMALVLPLVRAVLETR